MNDRIEYGKTTLEKLEEQGEQTIAKYGLDMFVNGIPKVEKEAPVVEPEQLAEEFPEIVQPTQEQTSTESEISVPTSEDIQKVEERVSEAEKSVESVKFAGEEEPGELARLFDDLFCDNETLEPRNETPVSRNDQPDTEHDKRVRKDVPFYLTIKNLLDRYEAGEITFDGMILDESRGIFRVDYAIA
jgi:hypothetical protein